MKTPVAPGFTLNDLVPAPANVVVLLGPLGLAFVGPTQPLPGVLPAGEPALPVWLEEPRTPLCFWGFSLPTRATPGIELWSFRLCPPTVHSLHGI